MVNTSDDGATRPSLASSRRPAASQRVIDTVTAAEGWVCNATVNVACPPPSVAGPLTALSSRPYSSSRMTRVAGDGAATPRPPVAVADTLTCLRPDAPALSTAVTVTKPVLAVAPAARVSVVVALSMKSPATAGATGAADTVKVVASVVGCDRRAVTVLTSPLSRTEAGVSTRVAVAVASSSVRVRVASAGFATPWPPAAVAETVTDLSAASTALSLPRTVTVPALVVDPAAIVSVVPVCVKSPATAPVEATAAVATVTVTGWLDGPDKVTVTVATPPFSETEVGARAKLAVGNVSSSLRVRVAPVTAPAPWPLAKVAVTVTLRPEVP